MFWKLCFSVISLSLMATTIYAERLQLCSNAKDASKRCLNGHLFIPSAINKLPFITTDILTGLQVKMGSTLDITAVPAEKHALVSGGAQYDLQIAVLDWLAVAGAFSGGFLSGVGGDIINFGTGGQFDYSLGGRFLLWKNSRFLISTSLDFLGTGYTGMDLLRFANSAPNLVKPIETCFNGLSNTKEQKKDKKAACASINNALKKFNYELGFNAEISMAMGINPAAGFRTNLGYQQLFRSKTDAADFKGQVYAGFAVSLDLSPVTPVPLGFLLGAQYAYRLDNMPSEFLHLGALTLHGGIFYTGSDHISVGLEVSDEMVPVGIGPVIERSNLFSGALNFGFYWN